MLYIGWFLALLLRGLLILFVGESVAKLKPVLLICALLLVYRALATMCGLEDLDLATNPVVACVRGCVGKDRMVRWWLG